MTSGGAWAASQAVATGYACTFSICDTVDGVEKADAAHIGELLANSSPKYLYPVNFR